MVQMDPVQRVGVKLPQAGDLVGRYSLQRELGTGGMAVVFAAVQQGAFERPVACKFLLPHLCGDENMQALFAAEARLLSQLANPHIPILFEAGQAQAVPFMAMELLEGETLESRLQRQTQIDPQMALAIVVQVAQALEAAHAARGFDGHPLHVVHRDVSPQNIHLGSNGVVKLLDFGIAASRERHRYTRTGELRGKLQYLAPEQITRTHAVSPQSDLWALGVVARELITGQSLFRGDSEATTLWNVTAAPVAPLAELCPTLPASVCDILDRCLHRDPDERPGSAGDVRRVLALALAEDAVQTVKRLMSDWQPMSVAEAPRAVVATPATREEPASQRRASASRRRWVAAAVVSAGLLGATAVGLVTPMIEGNEVAVAPAAFVASMPKPSHKAANVFVTDETLAPEPPLPTHAQTDAADPAARGLGKPKQRRVAKPTPTLIQEGAPAPARAAMSPLLANPY